jgi:hypothetical protein
MGFTSNGRCEREMTENCAPFLTGNDGIVTYGTQWDAKM